MAQDGGSARGYPVGADRSEEAHHGHIIAEPGGCDVGHGSSHDRTTA